MNSYKIDEQQVKKSTFETMPRLFKYLLKYKARIAFVFGLMAVGTAVDLVNPLLNEIAIDKYIMLKNVPGLLRIIALSVVINILAVLAIKMRRLEQLSTHARGAPKCSPTFRKETGAGLSMTAKLGPGWAVSDTVLRWRPRKA